MGLRAGSAHLHFEIKPFRMSTLAAEKRIPTPTLHDLPPFQCDFGRWAGHSSLTAVHCRRVPHSCALLRMSGKARSKLSANSLTCYFARSAKLTREQARSAANPLTPRSARSGLFTDHCPLFTALTLCSCDLAVPKHLQAHILPHALVTVEKHFFPVIL
jgi:hypothetical protein